MPNPLVHNDFAPISSYGEVFESNPHTQRADGIANLLCSPPQKGALSNHVNGDEFFHSNRFTQFADNIVKLLHLSPVNENDYQWDSTPVGRWETLAKTLPAIVTHGSIVVERGNPHFKGPPLVECPRCKSKLTRGTATITFQQAPPATQVQGVEAWVCSCGEFYVPGEIAREAYFRAFHTAITEGVAQYPLSNAELLGSLERSRPPQSWYDEDHEGLY